MSRNSLNELARQVETGILSLYRLCEGAQARHLDTERAERLLTETREAMAQESREPSESAQRMARRILKGGRPLTASRDRWPLVIQLSPPILDHRPRTQSQLGIPGQRGRFHLFRCRL